MAFFFVALVIGLAAVLFLWLYRREQTRIGQGETSLPTWRLVVAAVFGLLAMFSGGCSLLFLPEAISGNQYVDPVAILVIGGIPFVLAALIVWLSLRRGKG